MRGTYLKVLSDNTAYRAVAINSEWAILIGGKRETTSLRVLLLLSPVVFFVWEACRFDFIEEIVLCGPSNVTTFVNTILLCQKKVDSSSIEMTNLTVVCFSDVQLDSSVRSSDLIQSVSQSNIIHVVTINL